MADQTLGFDSLKEIVLGIAELATAGSAIMKDGIGFSDLKELPKLFTAVRHLTKMKIADIVPELKDLNDGEKAELALLFKDSFNIENDSMEQSLEEGMAIVVDGLQAILSFVNVSEKIVK